MWWLGSLTFHTFLAWPDRSKRPCRPAPPQCTECQGSQVISVETAIVTATACGVVGCATAGAAGARAGKESRARGQGQEHQQRVRRAHAPPLWTPHRVHTNGSRPDGTNAAQHAHGEMGWPSARSRPGDGLRWWGRAGRAWFEHDRIPVIVNVRLAVAPPRRNAPRSARAESGRPAGGSQALPVHV